MKHTPQFLYSEFGDLVKEMRKSKGYSLRDLADICKNKFSRHTVWLIENARQGVSMNQFIIIANALDISPVKLLEEYLNRVEDTGGTFGVTFYPEDGSDPIKK